jgi:hypothetical protein
MPSNLSQQMQQRCCHLSGATSLLRWKLTSPTRQRPPHESVWLSCNRSELQRFKSRDCTTSLYNCLLQLSLAAMNILSLPLAPHLLQQPATIDLMFSHHQVDHNFIK